MSRMEHTAIRLPDALVNRIERVRARMEEVAGVPVTFAAAMRRALEVGVEEELKRLGDPE